MAQDMDIEEVEEKDFDIRFYLFKILRFWWLFILCIGGAYTAAYFYNRTATPIYQATAKLLIKDDNNYSTNDLLKELDVDNKSKNIENEIQILKSHNIIETTVEQLDFGVAYYEIGSLRSFEVYDLCPFIVKLDTVLESAYYVPEILIDITDENEYLLHFEYQGVEVQENGEFGFPVKTSLGTFTIDKRGLFNNDIYKVGGASKRHFKIKFISQERNVGKYQSKLNIALISENSTILHLSIEETVPTKGKDFLNKLIEVYLANDVAEKNRMASKTSEFINERLEDISLKLALVENDRKNYKKENGIIDLSTESGIILNEISSLESKLGEYQTQIEIINYVETYLNENRDDLGKISPNVLNISDQYLSQKLMELSALASNRDIIIQQYTVGSPQYEELSKRINSTIQTIIYSLGNIKGGLNQQVMELNQQLRKLEFKISTIPTSEQELIEIERKLKITEGLYVYLQERKEEISISLASSASDNRVIEIGRATPYAIKPVKSRNYS
ncbi:MAG: tyrosine-protein kinase Etk/Wzc, partial [Parvicellaceae bacterium]